MPAVKKAFAANAWKLLSPASSRKIVLMPQMKEAASVLPSIRVRYTRWMCREVVMTWLEPVQLDSLATPGNRATVGNREAGI